MTVWHFMLEHRRSPFWKKVSGVDAELPAPIAIIRTPESEKVASGLS